MLRRRVHFYSICFAFGLSVLLILAGSRYTDNTNYRPSYENRKNIKNILKIEDGDGYDGSPNVEKLFERTRKKIKSELTNYNFSYSGVQKLEDLLMDSGGKPLRSLILSTWRSGTTFLGEILNAMPGNFYHYEPFLNYGTIQVRGPPYADKIISTIKNLFSCNYDGMEEYLEYGKTHINQFTHNTRLWDQCKYKIELCLQTDFRSKFCKLFPFQSMKIVRLRLKLIKDLLEDKDLNIRVVLLIRDPRGVMQSRQHHSFCKPAPDCWRPELLCADMISDYLAAARFLQQYPDQLMVLRYEDLALNPNSTSRKLLRTLRLGATPSVDAFLQTHTNIYSGGVSSTFKVSREVPFKWKNVLDFNYVDDIQRVCKEAMELWGYRMAHNATHMASKDFNPLTEYTITPLTEYDIYQ